MPDHRLARTRQAYEHNPIAPLVRVSTCPVCHREQVPCMHDILHDRNVCGQCWPQPELSAPVDYPRPQQTCERCQRVAPCRHNLFAGQFLCRSCEDVQIERMVDILTSVSDSDRRMWGWGV